MKKLVAGLLVAAVAVAGCNTSPPGGATGGSSRVSSYGPGDGRPAVGDAGRPAVGDAGRPPVGDAGRPAADSPRGNAPLVGGSDTFRLMGPGVLGTSDVTLKQGEKKEVTVKISRGSNFKENVKLQIKTLPKGVTVTPEKPAIGAGDTEDKLMVEAAKDAALGDHVIEVTGIPEKGAEATLPLKVHVDKGGESK
jgi:hypothetical protein